MRQRPGHLASRLKNNTRYSIYTYLWTGHGPYCTMWQLPGYPTSRLQNITRHTITNRPSRPPLLFIACENYARVPRRTSRLQNICRYETVLYHTFTPSQCLIGHVSCWIGCATTTRVSHIQVAKNYYSLYTLYTYCLLMGHRGSIYCSEACGNYFYPSIPHPGCKIFTRYQYIYQVPGTLLIQ